ncbi:hypothetical protein POVWA1_065390 [Plasmodium ovale wallikeri]|uniref:Kelch domain-containing protein n=1 Tax=Plasmodium ovale wallikeri TaxID=864142 RepID=A0A1A9ABX3_PLAOA|nr:hypothetical protein POVWA1_065390 [Plasmodium ovale wallikeri]
MSHAEIISKGENSSSEFTNLEWGDDKHFSDIIREREKNKNSTFNHENGRGKDKCVLLCSDEMCKVPNGVEVTKEWKNDISDRKYENALLYKQNDNADKRKEENFTVILKNKVISPLSRGDAANSLLDDEHGEGGNKDRREGISGEKSGNRSGNRSTEEIKHEKRRSNNNLVEKKVITHEGNSFQRGENHYNDFIMKSVFNKYIQVIGKKKDNHTNVYILNENKKSIHTLNSPEKSNEPINCMKVSFDEKNRRVDTMEDATKNPDDDILNKKEVTQEVSNSSYATDERGSIKEKQTEGSNEYTFDIAQQVVEGRQKSLINPLIFTLDKNNEKGIERRNGIFPNISNSQKDKIFPYIENKYQHVFTTEKKEHEFLSSCSGVMYTDGSSDSDMYMSKSMVTMSRTPNNLKKLNDHCSGKNAKGVVDNVPTSDKTNGCIITGHGATCFEKGERSHYGVHHSLDDTSGLSCGDRSSDGRSNSSEGNGELAPHGCNNGGAEFSCGNVVKVEPSRGWVPGKQVHPEYSAMYARNCAISCSKNGRRLYEIQNCAENSTEECTFHTGKQTIKKCPNFGTFFDEKCSEEIGIKGVNGDTTHWGRNILNMSEFILSNTKKFQNLEKINDLCEMGDSFENGKCTLKRITTNIFSSDNYVYSKTGRRWSGEDVHFAKGKFYDSAPFFINQMENRGITDTLGESCKQNIVISMNFTNGEKEISKEYGENGTCTNGACTNGTCTNGACTNGACTNGACTNGTCTNGACTNGTCTNGACTNGACTNGTCTNGTCTNGTCTSGTEKHSDRSGICADGGKFEGFTMTNQARNWKEKKALFNPNEEGKSERYPCMERNSTSLPPISSDNDTIAETNGTMNSVNRGVNINSHLEWVNLLRRDKIGVTSREYEKKSKGYILCENRNSISNFPIFVSSENDIDRKKNEENEHIDVDNDMNSNTIDLDMCIGLENLENSRGEENVVDIGIGSCASSGIVNIGQSRLSDGEAQKDTNSSYGKDNVKYFFNPQPGKNDFFLQRNAPKNFYNKKKDELVQMSMEYNRHSDSSRSAYHVETAEENKSINTENFHFPVINRSNKNDEHVQVKHVESATKWMSETDPCEGDLCLDDVAIYQDCQKASSNTDQEMMKKNMLSQMDGEGKKVRTDEGNDPSIEKSNPSNQSSEKSNPCRDKSNQSIEKKKDNRNGSHTTLSNMNDSDESRQVDPASALNSGINHCVGLASTPEESGKVAQSESIGKKWKPAGGTRWDENYSSFEREKMNEKNGTTKRRTSVENNIPIESEKRNLGNDGDLCKESTPSSPRALPKSSFKGMIENVYINPNLNFHSKYKNKHISAEERKTKEKCYEEKSPEEGRGRNLGDPYKWERRNVNYPKDISFKKAFFFNFNDDIYIYGAKKNNFVIPDKLYKFRKKEIEEINTKGATPLLYLKIFFLFDTGEQTLSELKSCVYNNARETKMNTYDYESMSSFMNNKREDNSNCADVTKDGNSFTKLPKEDTSHCVELSKGSWKNKCFYIFGCKERRLLDLYTLYKLDLVTLEWEEIKLTYNKELNLSREDFSLTLVNKCFYLYGGVVLERDKWKCSGELWKCNIEKGTWEMLTRDQEEEGVVSVESSLHYNIDMPTPFNRMAKLAKSDDGLNGNQQNKGEEINKNRNITLSMLHANQFEEKRPNSRACHLCVFYENKIYIHGGTDLTEEKDDFYFFDLQKKKWFEIVEHGNSRPSRRYGHSGFIIKDKLYIYGGFTKYGKCNIVNNDLFEYTFEHNTWKQIFTIDDLLYLKIVLNKEPKELLHFLQLIVLRGYYKGRFTNCLKFNQSQHDVADVYTGSEHIEEKFSTYCDLFSDVCKFRQRNVPTDVETKGEGGKKENMQKESNIHYEEKKKNYLTYLRHGDDMLKDLDSSLLFGKKNTAEVKTEDIGVSSQFRCPYCSCDSSTDVMRGEEGDKPFFPERTEAKINLYTNFLSLDVLNDRDSAIIPHNIFRSKCLSFDNSLYLLGGCGMGNNSLNDTENNFFYYDDIFTIKMCKTYTDFILHYLLHIDNFFFKFIEKVKSVICKYSYGDEKIETTYKTLEEYNTNCNLEENIFNYNKTPDMVIKNFPKKKKKKDNDFLASIGLRVKRIDDELENMYMNILAMGDGEAECNEDETCNRHDDSFQNGKNDQKDDTYEGENMHDNNLNMSGNKKLEKTFLFVQNKKMYALLTFLLDLYDNFYAHVRQCVKNVDEREDINAIHRICEIMLKGSVVEHNSDYPSCDVIINEKEQEGKMNDNTLSEKVEKGRFFFPNNKAAQGAAKTDAHAGGTRCHSKNCSRENEDLRTHPFNCNVAQCEVEGKGGRKENEYKSCFTGGTLYQIVSRQVEKVLPHEREQVGGANHHEFVKEQYVGGAKENCGDAHGAERHAERHAENACNREYAEDGKKLLNWTGTYHPNGDILHRDAQSNGLFTNCSLLCRDITKNGNFLEYSECANLNGDEENQNSDRYFDIPNVLLTFSRDWHQDIRDNKKENNITPFGNMTNVKQEIITYDEKAKKNHLCNYFEKNSMMEKYLNIGQVNLNMDKSIIYNYLENFDKLCDEKYTVKMKIRRNDIYKLIYTYTKSVEIQNSIYLEKIKNFEQQLEEYFTQNNTPQLCMSQERKKNEENDSFNDVNFEKLKQEHVHLKRKVQYLHNITNVYCIQIEKQKIYIKILESKQAYLINCLLKLKSILHKEDITDEMRTFFQEDNFFIHEKNNNAYGEILNPSNGQYPYTFETNYSSYL